MRSRSVLARLAAFAAVTVPLAQAALFEPPGNQVLLGAWIDTSYDTPFKYNTRVGQNISMFQVAQQIPLPAYNWVTGAGGPAPAYQILQTSTSAYIALTVYPSSFNIAASDYQQLGQQILNYTTNYNRSVFLRFAPEMQGTWMPYGFQPSKFIPMWETMYTTLHSIVPSGLAIVWAPNTGQSYPYGQQTNVQADLRLLDTNGDGQVTAADDAFSPFYPGDQYVDWIGMSVYYKGPNEQNINQPQTAGFCGQALDNVNPNTGQQAGPSNFYQVYCAGKPNVACMYAESGAAYHTNVTYGATQLAIQQAWMEGCTFNETFYDTYPRLKGFFQFEHAKYEYDGGVQDFRDYRVTNATDVLSAYSSHLSVASTRFLAATPTTLPLGLQTAGRPANLPGGSANSTSTAAGIVFQTTRPFDRGVPTLFGVTAGGQRTLQAVTLSFTAGIAGCVAVFVSRRRSPL